MLLAARSRMFSLMVVRSRRVRAARALLDASLLKGMPLLKLFPKSNKVLSRRLLSWMQGVLTHLLSCCYDFLAVEETGTCIVVEFLNAWFRL